MNELCAAKDDLEQCEETGNVTHWWIGIGLVTSELALRRGLKQRGTWMGRGNQGSSPSSASDWLVAMAEISELLRPSFCP